MTVFEQLQQDLGGYLHVTGEIIDAPGGSVNVGEKFTVRFTLTNTAPPPTAVMTPKIIFESPYIQFSRTEYAAPLDLYGEEVYSVGHNFPDDRLEPGESSFRDFEMIALKAMGKGIMAWFLKEQIAKVYVNGRLDPSAFFKIWNKTDVYGQIYPNIAEMEVFTRKTSRRQSRRRR